MPRKGVGRVIHQHAWSCGYGSLGVLSPEKVTRPLESCFGKTTNEAHSTRLFFIAVLEVLLPLKETASLQLIRVLVELVFFDSSFFSDCGACKWDQEEDCSHGRRRSPGLASSFVFSTFLYSNYSLALLLSYPLTLGITQKDFLPIEREYRHGQLKSKLEAMWRSFSRYDSWCRAWGLGYILQVQY